MHKTVSIDGQSYDLDALSEEVLEHLSIMKAAKSELQNLNNLLTFLETSKEVYIQSISSEISNAKPTMQFGMD